MRKTINRWKQLITDEATSHDKVRGAHWEIISLGGEGHTGWEAGITEIDQHWIDDVVSARGGKGRSLGEIRGEIWRSKINGFRKVKVRVENARSAGADYPPAQCSCAQRQAIAQGGGVVATMGGNAGGLFVSDGDSENDDAGPPDGLDGISWGNANSPDEYEMNDDGNGEFLMDLLRSRSGRIKFVKGYGWLFWTDGTVDEPSRWIVDPVGEKGEPGPLIRRAFWRVKRMQALFADQKLEEAQQALDNNGGQRNAQINAMFAIAKKWQSWSLKSGNNVAANSAINAAKNQPDVLMDINQLNSNWRLLGVANGVIELRDDGPVLRAAHQNDFVTVNTNVPWTQWSGIPRHDIGRKMWEEYLDRFIPEHRRSYYQMVLGHMIIGGNQERIMPILLGGTSTGKSTMLHAIRSALGEYSGTVNISIFAPAKLNPELAQAIPMRAVFISELSAGDRISASMLKRVTGDDELSAELKGVNVIVRSKPAFVPLMATNTAPEIEGHDEAVRKRLMVLSFDQRIEDRKDEKGAGNKLAKYASEAVLAWLLDGYSMYCAVGQRLPRDVEVERQTDLFSSQLDPVGEFVSERVREVANSVVTVPEMYQAYCDWCKISGIVGRDVLSSQKLARRLDGLGFKQSRAYVDGKQKRGYMSAALTRVNRRGSSVHIVPDQITMTTQSDEKESENKQK